MKEKIYMYLKNLPRKILYYILISILSTAILYGLSSLGIIDLFQPTYAMTVFDHLTKDDVFAVKTSYTLAYMQCVGSDHGTITLGHIMGKMAENTPGFPMGVARTYLEEMCYRAGYDGLKETATISWPATMQEGTHNSFLHQTILSYDHRSHGS